MTEGKDYWVKVKEESTLMKLLSWLYFWDPTFIKTHTMTVFRTIYAPNGKVSGAQLAHECQHIQDFRDYHVWYLFSSAFLLPAFWTMRAHWERRAYTHNIRAWVANNGKHADSSGLQKQLVDQFCTSKYLWMWPNEKAVREWVLETIKNA